MTTALIGATGRLGSDVAEAFDGIRLVFIAMGSIGIEGVLQRIAINVPPGSPRSSRSPAYRSSTPWLMPQHPPMLLFGPDFKRRCDEG